MMGVWLHLALSAVDIGFLFCAAAVESNSVASRSGLILHCGQAQLCNRQRLVSQQNKQQNLSFESLNRYSCQFLLTIYQGSSREFTTIIENSG